MSRRARRVREGHSMSRLPTPPTVWGAGAGFAAATSPASTPTSPPGKPIYIYPGLLRVMRQSAIALDSRCPAAVYKCVQCQDEGQQAPGHRCAHANACPICLDVFHGKDLVRRMPCNVQHVFHTRCILNWVSTNDRCPLCNDVVSAHPVKQKVHICEDQSASLRSLRRPPPGAATRPRSQMTPAQRAQTLLSRPRRVDEVFSPSPRSRPVNDTVSMRDLRRNDVVRNTREYQSGPLPRRKRGPRTYSNIVYDSVRMEVDLQQH